MDYKKVIEDYKSGEIDRNQWTLVIDNDGGYWSYTGPCSWSDETTESMREEMVRKYGEPGGYNDIVEVLLAAGVNTEWV